MLRIALVSESFQDFHVHSTNVQAPLIHRDDNNLNTRRLRCQPYRNIRLAPTEDDATVCAHHGHSCDAKSPVVLHAGYSLAY
jgi:hypothetical protein